MTDESLSEFEQKAVKRFHEGSPIGVKQEYDTVHEAAFDVFVTSRKHGRELWHLHFHADVALVDSFDDMTHVQSIVLKKLDGHWSEKAREKGKQKTPNAPRTPSTSSF